MTVVEAQSRILPQYDADLTRPVARRLRELGIEVLLGAKAKGLSSSGNALSVETADGQAVMLPADQDPRYGWPETQDRRLGPGCD